MIFTPFSLGMIKPIQEISCTQRSRLLNYGFFDEMDGTEKILKSQITCKFPKGYKNFVKLQFEQKITMIKRENEIERIIMHITERDE